MSPCSGASFLERSERHAQIRPAHVRAERDHAPVRRTELSLNAKRNATRAAAAREIAHRAKQVLEPRFIVQGELQHAQLLSCAPLDQWSRVREREADQPIAVV